MERKEKRNLRVTAQLLRLVRQFVHQHSPAHTIVTVTKIETSRDYSHAVIYLSTYPDDKEKEVLKYFTKKVSLLRDSVAKDNKTRIRPFFSFAEDKGEKNRRRIDDIIHHTQKSL